MNGNDRRPATMFIGSIVLGLLLRESVDLTQPWDGWIDLSVAVKTHS